jgi:hypothetical protein
MSHIHYRRPNRSIPHLTPDNPPALAGPSLAVINYLLTGSIAISNPRRYLDRDANDDDDLDVDHSAIADVQLKPCAAVSQEDCARVQISNTRNKQGAAM